MKALIYGKNKCIWCDRAKNLLEENNVEYDYRNIEDEPKYREEMRDKLPTAMSVPQIFLDGEYVGGFTELNAKSKQWQNT